MRVHQREKAGMRAAFRRALDSPGSYERTIVGIPRFECAHQMSIKRRLLVSLIAVLIAAIAVTGALVYRQARDEANGLFDAQLRQLAASLPVRAFGALAPEAAGIPYGDDDVVVRIWNRFGVFVYSSHPDTPLPLRAQLGYATVPTASGDWRTFAGVSGDSVVEVAQPMRVRRVVAAQVALRTVAPLIVLVPVLAALLWFVVGRGLAPLHRVARDVASRSPAALDPLRADALPDEIAPLVEALNRLLARLGETLAAQRAFIADAAHGLRTPITALQLQLQVAERATDAATRDSALAAARAGLARTGHLVEQLLALARAEPEAGERPTQRVDLRSIARDVVATHTPLAVARRIDLGVAIEGEDSSAAESDAFAVTGEPDALATMLANLVDNALRYTPEGGRVDVVVRGSTVAAAGAPVLEVRDTGPGIAPAEREHVFARFHRGRAAHAAGQRGQSVASGGSGLGLAIVARVVERHGARITLGAANPLDETGLVATIEFPKQNSSHAIDL